MFKADIEIHTMTKQGWDTYREVEVRQLHAPSLKGIKAQIEKLQPSDRYGDFGICLGSTTINIIKCWEVIQEEEIKIVEL